MKPSSSTVRRHDGLSQALICQSGGLGLREGGDGAEVVVDVEHGGIQQGVDVLETLKPRLQAPSALRLQLPQLLLGQPGQRRRRGRHGRHWGGGGGGVE